MVNPKAGAIIGLYTAGDSYGLIAAKLGVSRNAVAGIIYRARQDGRLIGYRDPAISRAKTYWQGEVLRDAKLEAEALSKAGVATEVIASRIGVCPTTIDNWFRGGAGRRRK